MTAGFDQICVTLVRCASGVSEFSGDIIGLDLGLIIGLKLCIMGLAEPPGRSIGLAELPLVANRVHVSTSHRIRE